MTIIYYYPVQICAGTSKGFCLNIAMKDRSTCLLTYLLLIEQRKKIRNKFIETENGMILYFHIEINTFLFDHKCKLLASSSQWCALFSNEICYIYEHPIKCIVVS